MPLDVPMLNQCLNETEQEQPILLFSFSGLPKLKPGALFSFPGRVAETVRVQEDKPGIFFPAYPEICILIFSGGTPSLGKQIWVPARRQSCPKTALQTRL
jgi:hypothetical protein